MPKPKLLIDDEFIKLKVEYEEAGRKRSFELRFRRVFHPTRGEEVQIIGAFEMASLAGTKSRTKRGEVRMELPLEQAVSISKIFNPRSQT